MNYRMIDIFRKLSLVGTALSLSACLEGGSDFQNLESSGKNPNNEGIGRCSILETSPSNASSLRVSGASSGATTFTITPQGTDCTAKYYLNGSTTALGTGASLILNSSVLSSGTNTLRVELTGPIGSDFKEWTLVKNELPTCALVTPAVANINATQGVAQNLMISSTVESGETASFQWLMNGSTSSRLTKLIEGGGASQYAFDTASLTGSQNIKAVISDGTDTVSCEYNVNVGEDCALTAKSPNVTSLKLANSGASQAFAVTASTAGCVVSWTLNGAPVTGTGTNQTVLSSNLTAGSNLLKATVVATSGTTEQSWLVVKNSVPVCAQSPSGSQSMSSGDSRLLQSLFSDPDSDSMTWSWKVNGATVSAPLLTVTDGVNSTSGTFAPTDSNLGFNTVAITVNDGYDSVNCNWSVNVNPACTISSKSPNTSALTIANLGTTSNVFAVTPSTGSCAISWVLNGINLGSALSLQTLLSSSFAGTPNTLVATVSNGTSSDSHTWTVTKNTLPVCATQTPSTSGFVLGVGASQAFYAGITDSDSGQSHSFNWKLDGNTPHASYFTEVTNATNSTGTWVPLSGQAGSHNLAVDVFDGYDTRTCSWSTTIMPNCSISSATPSGASLKVAAAPSTSTSFAAVANDGSCSIAWTLDGTNVGSGSFNSVLSSALSGSNTLVATASNAVSTTTRSWTVTKNTISTCSGQAPSATGSSIDIGDFLNLTGTAGNSDGDTLAFEWLFSGATTSSFSDLASTASQSSVKFTPTISQVGTSQLLRLNINDGYDVSQCDWSVDVVDPDQAQILSWSPTSNPVVILSTGSVDFSVVATGTDRTYAWYLDGSLLPSRTNSTETFSYSDLAVGTYALKVVVTDTYNNTAEHTFNVKRNAKPVIGAFTPNESGVSSYRVGVSGTLGFSVSATDGNSDTLTYEWTLNSASSDKITPSGSGTTKTFGPAGDTLLVGAHVVRVSVTDGHETSTQAWNVSVNYFSDECNNLFNSAASGPNGGKACTLVGSPSMGDGEDITSDTTLYKGTPHKIIELEPNVYAFSDMLNHVVVVYNKSGASKSYFGKSVPSNQMKVVLGYGQRGFNNDVSSLTAAFNGVTGQPTVKLWHPVYLYYDSSITTLYVSDYYNHRVLAINANGDVQRVLGRSNRATTTTQADAIGSGQNVSCSYPIGLAVNQEGANKYLYVACSGHNSLKKVDVTTFTGTNSPTFTTTVAVGRFTSNSSAVYAAGYSDGAAGYDNTPASGAVAQLNTPAGIFAFNGLIYIADAYRIRVYNPTADNRVFYDDYLTNADRFITNTTADNFYFRSVSLENTWTTHSAIKSRLSVMGTDTPDAYTFVVPGTRTIGACHLGIIEAKKAGSRIKVGSSTNVDVTMSNTESGVYLTPDCSDAAAVMKTVTIPAGQSFGAFWFKLSSTAARTVSIVTPAANATVTAAAENTSAAPAHTQIYTSSHFDVSDCAPIHMIVSAVNASTATRTLTATVNLAPMTNNFGTFYSDASCTTQLPNQRTTLANGTVGAKTVFFNRKVLLAPNSTQSIFGYVQGGAPFAGNGGGTFALYSTNFAGSIVSVGGGYYQNSTGRDLAPIGSQTVATFQYPEGIFYASYGSNNLDGNTTTGWGPNGINLVNISAADFSLTPTVHKYSTRVIAGSNNDRYAPNYNGDDQAAYGSNFSDIYGVSVTADENSLLVADRGNNRGRRIELDASTNVRQFLGLGRVRERANALQIQANAAALARPFKLELFSNKLYFSELNNNRIRRVDLTTGITEVVAGAGYGTSFNEGNDATAEVMRSPRGFKMIAWPNTLSPTNYILVYSEACQIRAVNVAGPTISSFMGVSNILPGKVKTIAGDTAVTCQASTQWPTWNSNGMTALNARFWNVYDVAYINSQIYIIDYSENCLMRVDSTGKLYEATAGSCGATASSVAGEIGSAFKSLQPIGFGPDMGFSGNYFLLDRYGQSTAKVTYINTSTANDRYFVSNTVFAPKTTNVGRVSDIYDIAVSGSQARPGGITSWAQTPGIESANDRICWTSGDVDTSIGNAVQGAHAVYCAKRTDADTGSIAVGPLTGAGAGGPLGREQEGVNRNNITMWGPTGVAFDEEGNLYIADSGNNIIRMIRRWW